MRVEPPRMRVEPPRMRVEPPGMRVLCAGWSRECPQVFKASRRQGRGANAVGLCPESLPPCLLPDRLLHSRRPDRSWCDGRRSRIRVRARRQGSSRRARCQAGADLEARRRRNTRRGAGRLGSRAPAGARGLGRAGRHRCGVLAYVDAQTRLLPTRIIAPTYAVLVACLLALGRLPFRGLVFFLCFFCCSPPCTPDSARQCGFLFWLVSLLVFWEVWIIFSLWGFLPLLSRGYPFGPFMLVGALVGLLWGRSRLPTGTRRPELRRREDSAHVALADRG